ncbi:MAG TPA: class I SAM-dependent methyltransferase [Solirubrobacteraceae bacterium]|jgi:SAM-dependent methyltransferase|nr:class I SAM-dependent methyltransferase [Solirubrobacteraceae bacterium]
MKPESANLVEFYDESYAREGGQAELYARWRALGAKGKADHAMKLCGQADIRPATILDVGCGDGALLSELRRRGFGRSLHGVEIAEAAVRIAGERTEIDSVELYDGVHLDAPGGSYDLGIVSHVLEHVVDPATLLAEMGRACKAVVMEVPLEANVSARRAGKRKHAEEVGHLQRLSRDSARAIMARAGLQIAGELEDPLPLRAQSFFAQTPMAHAAAVARWAVRSGLHRLSPPVARRLFTVHYACLCLPR